MKLFKELKTGDNIYIIGTNFNQGIIFTRVSKFSKFIHEEENVEDDGDSTALLEFIDVSETGILVFKGESIHRRKLKGTSTELNYFADPFEAEKFLKNIREKVMQFQERIDTIYTQLWENANSKETETDTDMEIDSSGYKIGEIIYSTSFNMPVLYVGNGVAICSDGIELRTVLRCPKNFRKSLSGDDEKFFKECSDTLKGAQGIYREGLLDALKTCGYFYNENKKIIEKNRA
jgi:hypothetical protein